MLVWGIELKFLENIPQSLLPGFLYGGEAAMSCFVFSKANVKIDSRGTLSERVPRTPILPDLAAQKLLTATHQPS